MAQSKRSIEPPAGSPWPYVKVGGQLERAEMEWLHTNGAGAFAMSTVALMHTRRHHGLLVAALTPPLGRHVILSHAEMELQIGPRLHRLAAHRFPGVAPMPGYRQLEEFAQAPLPTWRFGFGRASLTRSMCLVRGQNAVVISFTLGGEARARLRVRPLHPLRPMHDLTSEHGGMRQAVTMRRHHVEIRPQPSLPSIHFLHSGLFVGSPDWWRRFEYSKDQLEHNTEDLWTPGTFELTLERDVTRYLVVSLGDPPEAPPEALMEEARSYLLTQDPGPERPRAVRQLHIAADHFCVERCARPAIISGYPFFGVWSRDTCLALPGLLLARGKLDSAKAVLGQLLTTQQGGLFPRRIPEKELAAPSARPIPAGFGRSEFSAVDSTLWLFPATEQLLKHTGLEDAFVRDQLYPALSAAFDAVREGRPDLGLGLTEDGLVMGAAPGTSPNDPSPGHSAWGRRLALPIELQALWFSAAKVLGQLAAAYGDQGRELLAEVAAEQVRASVEARFWCDVQRYPYDSLPVQPDQPGDDRIRPHALIALAIAPELFEAWQARAILDRVEEHLLTPGGVRSLTPDAPDYLGHFEGSFEEREAAYHRGAAWVYLLGFYAQALIRHGSDDFETKEDVYSRIQQLLEEPACLGHLSQLANGDPPHRPAGAPAQALSVAMLLWTLCVELGR
ncbi:MAG: glycogen debranching enzyme family protein [Polyangiaceae bacterium]|nr:glycogen debranching enzyme family protein [Polyangiaceae bacterium]MCW5792654.1 glycogen debranching enzyme family protein [Polyangiaceae bacterium]